MAFEIPRQPYSGKIGVVTLGAGSSAMKLGGEESYPFHLFEGNMTESPKIAMEIWDYDPSDEWPAAAIEPFSDVVSSPDIWAKKCVETYGADIIVVQLKSTDPNGLDRDPKEAAQAARKVLDAVEVPVVFWGTANNQKDEEVLKMISESCEGKNIGLAPVEEGCHKGVGASALGYGHTVVASTPIDVNLAKQLNILLGNLGVSMNKIVVDPTTGGLGYGMEYSYSVMERIRMAALTQEDDKLQSPMINNIGNEIWKCKEAGDVFEELPTLGDSEKRGILMEAVAAVCYLLGGSDVVILRHPQSVRLTRSFIDLILNGGMASEVEPISKRLPLQEPDLTSISPEPNLDFPEVKAAPKPAKKEKVAAKPKKEEKKPEAPPKPEKKVVELKAKEKAEEAAKAKAEAELRTRAEVQDKEKAEEEATAEAEAAAKEKAEVEATARAEAQARAKAEEEARARAEAEARARAEEEARARAEAAAKEKAEEEVRAKTAAKAKEKEELKALRQKRAAEREKLEADRKAAEATATPKTAAQQQLSLVDKLIQNLDRIHRRV